MDLQVGKIIEYRKIIISLPNFPAKLLIELNMRCLLNKIDYYYTIKFAVACFNVLFFVLLCHIESSFS